MIGNERRAVGARIVFTQSHAGERRDREDDTRDRIVRRGEVVAFEQIRGYDASFVGCNWSQRGTIRVRAIAGGVYEWVRHTLQVLVHGDARLGVANSARVERKIVEIRHATRP